MNLRAFSSFHTCSLTALESKLTEVAWITRKNWSSGVKDRWTFLGTNRTLRSFLIAHKEYQIIFFAELNEDNFYMKIIDLDEIYNFLVLSFFYLKSLRNSKKINDIFTPKSIFVFSHLQFNDVRVQTDGSGMESTKKLEQWRWRPLNFFRGTHRIAIFYNGTQGKVSSIKTSVKRWANRWTNGWMERDRGEERGTGLR